jgi:hypothetical protein
MAEKKSPRQRALLMKKRTDPKEKTIMEKAKDGSYKKGRVSSLGKAACGKKTK